MEHKLPPLSLSCHLAPWGSRVEQAMAEIAGLGFPACEMGSGPFLRYRTEPERWRDLLMRHRLTVAALFEFGHFENRARRREVLLHHDHLAFMMERAGIGLVVLSAGSLRKRSGPTVDDLKQMTEMIAQIVHRYRERGICVGVHPHVGTSIFTRDEIDFVMDKGPEDLHLVPDLWHCAEAEIDAPSLIAVYAERIASIHLRDARKRAAGGRRLRTEPCDLGEGELDLRRLYCVLRDCRYSGWLTVESERPEVSPRASASKNLHYLQNRWFMDENRWESGGIP
ncbi:MAG: sugar phosphate isomerase/epimerase [Brevibacillus sp.]|nr:sugar phosphate isomerase/epimerase [Brevibacillus sp.]